MKKFILSLLTIVASISLHAYPTLSDKTVISMLTYAKTNEIHAMYGHTAIRVKDSVNHVDLIFNYGTFDFQSPNFVYRFTKGDADYILSVTNFEYLPIESYIRHMSVREQVLNLNPDEKQKVFDALMINAEPQNRSYKYNFLFDNCATRPRLIIENNVEGKIIYKDSIPTLTFRRLIHDCTGKHQWLTFGIDLILGSELDRKSTYIEQMFLPQYMEDAYRRAVIVDSVGVERKLVVSDQEILPAEPLTAETEPYLLSPNAVTAFFMVLIFLVSFLGFRKKRLYAWIDVVLFLIYGLAGSLIFFMTFISTHPATNPNYALFVMHPLHLLFAITCLIPPLKRHLVYYHMANAAILAVFLLLVWFLPQQFAVAFLFLTFTLLFRSFFRTLLFIKR